MGGRGGGRMKEKGWREGVDVSRYGEMCSVL